MSWSYSVKEGLAGLRRARLSSLICISMVAVSLVLVGIFLVATVNMNSLLQDIKKRMNIEVFISDVMPEAEIANLEEQIRAIEGIGVVAFISKENAAQEVRDELGIDVFEIYEENPLFSSFRISLDTEYKTNKAAEDIVTQINRFEGVNEVVYRQEIFRLLDRYIGIALVIDLAVGLIVLFSSLFVISNTIRLIIHSKRDIIETMKLVGATRSFIRRPFLVEGMVQGVLGGILAAALLYVLVKILRIELAGLIVVEEEIYALLVVIGLIFGWLGSMTAARRFIRYQ